MEPLLEVKNLQTEFPTREGVVHAVNGISYTVLPGEAVGIVGESGCGKSVSALSILNLVPKPGRVVGGEVLFDGQDLLALTQEEIRKVRGNDVSMIFQDPMTSFNPVLTILRQLTEPLVLHKGMDMAAAERRAVELMEMVEIPFASVGTELEVEIRGDRDPIRVEKLPFYTRHRKPGAAKDEAREGAKPAGA